MSYASVLALINSEIVANGNNEITADVLRPVLQAMLLQPNELIGVLSNLDTSDITNIVNAINSILSGNLANSTALRPIDTTGVDFDQDELLWVRDAINNTASNNGAFTCDLGQQMVFYCDVIVSNLDGIVTLQTRYYRLTTGATSVVSLGTGLNPPLMPDGSYISLVDLSGDLVIDLGDIGTDDIEDAFNSDGDQPFTISGLKFIQAVQNGDNKLWQWIGGDGDFGNSATVALASYFVDLTGANTPPIEDPDYREFVVKQVSDTIDDATSIGQIQVETDTGEVVGILFDPVFSSKYLFGIKKLLDDEAKDIYIKSFNKSASSQALYLAKVLSIEFSDVAETCYIVELDTNLTGSEFAVTDKVEVFFDMDSSSGTGTVTSVAISGSDGIEIDSGSPITTSGTIALGVNASTLRSHINVEDGADATDATNVNAAGAVMESDYNANTILAANSDDTPSPLEITEQTLLGRITSGNIASLSVTQIKSLLAYIESDINGVALYNATTTGAVNIPCSTFASWYRVLTGNTTLTFTETPASGESFTRFMTIVSTAAETLAFANADFIVGEYANDTTENFITVELSNYPTVGLQITVYINQEA